MKHDTEWHTAAPLWDLSLADAGASPARFKQPTLLRFRGEAFIEELEAALGGDPEALAGYVARGEQWDAEGAGWLAEGELPDAPVKLYQPVHDRFYLLAASLVCRTPGLPDRAVDRGADEAAGFVIRRIEPAVAGGAIDPANEASWREHGWIGNRQKGSWQALTERRDLAPGEERHKLFSLAFDHEGQPRRLHAGMIPVAGREIYEEAAAAGRTLDADELADDPLADPRLAELVERVETALTELGEPAPGLTDADAREAFLFTLLDLAELLEKDVNDVWASLDIGSAGLNGAERALRALFHATSGHPAPPLVDGATWGQLLLDAAEHRGAILDGSLTLPPLLAALAPTRAQLEAASDALLAAGLVARYEAALPDLPPAPAADAGGGGAAADDDEPIELLYVARLVYERPRCGAVHPPLVSAATAPFELASFFDADAPVRPVRIRLPFDTSVKGLRRFPKAASFLISKQLRKQIEKIEGLGIEQVEDGQLNAPSGNLNFGVIWVLSIPIITICALILLMIIVQLLNIVFWWLPFFKIAIPVKLESSS